MNGARKVDRKTLRRYLTLLHFQTISQVGGGADRVCAQVRARQAIQFDPINVVGRNADLALQSRIDGYRPEMLAQAAYGEHRLYDGYDKNLCLFLPEDYPYLARLRASNAAWFRENPELKAAEPAVLEEIDRRGALCSDDLQVDGQIRWPWGRAKLGRAALEDLWMDGTLCIARRDGVRKYYDRFERCYDPKLRKMPEPNPSDRDWFAWQALRRTRSVGFLTGGASDALLCVDGMKAAERRAAFERLCAEKKLIPVETEGLKGFIPADNEDVLLRAEREEPEKRVRFLAPLDNLLWDRRLVEAIFGFEYRWEVYVPAEKRKYGYYVLPVMCGDELIARMEPERFDGTTFRIARWWWEPGKGESDLPAHALDDAMVRFAAYLGTDQFDRSEIRNG